MQGLEDHGGGEEAGPMGQAHMSYSNLHIALGTGRGLCFGQGSVWLPQEPGPSPALVVAPVTSWISAGEKASLGSPGPWNQQAGEGIFAGSLLPDPMPSNHGRG